MIEPYALPGVATAPAALVAMKWKSRREDSAAVIAATVRSSSALPVNPPALKTARAATCGGELRRIRPGEDQKRRDPAAFIGTLTGRVQGVPSPHPQGPPAGLVPSNFAMRIALYEPDIPQNTGTILRLCACLGVAADIIEPAGFPTSDRAFRRAGMDYVDAVAIARHASWPDFESWRHGKRHRLVLFTTAAPNSYLDYHYLADDILLFGRESAGAPEHVHAAADARLVIPMQPGLRSLNVAVAAAMAVGEALRQTGFTGS
jgi:tRNA (cytidine/uridine-2'-O-)-methyltransferase